MAAIHVWLALKIVLTALMFLNAMLARLELIY